MEQKWVFLIVGALTLVVLALFGLVLFLVFQLHKQLNGQLNKELVEQKNRLSDLMGEDLSENKNEEVENLKKQAQQLAKEASYCVNHPQDYGVGVCSICQKTYCDACLKDHEGLNFCDEHFRLFLNHEWVTLEEIMTTPDTPESALAIYDFKQDLWKVKATPTIISTHYKINIEGDHIESYVKLIVRKEEQDKLRSEFEGRSGQYQQ